MFARHQNKEETVNARKRSHPGPITLGHVEEGSAFLELAARQDGAGEAEARKFSALPSPAKLTEHALAFHRTAALRAAVGLDVFTAIGEGYDTPAALAERCRAAEHGVRILCDYLVSLDLLARREGRYTPAPDAAAYLGRRSPAYIGDALDFIASDTILKAALGNPATVVRNGGTILDGSEQLTAPDHEDWTTYARALAPMMARSADFLADLIASHDGTVRRILDIAAGPGQNGIALARRLPESQVTATDWANVLEVATGKAHAAGLGERWQALPGNSLEVELGGPYDVALIVRFLHLLSVEERETLLRRVHAALAPGGRVAILQLTLNDDRSSPPFAAMMNFSVLATTPAGELPTASELEALIRKAGFRRIEWYDVPDSDERIVIGRKRNGGS
jgi:2-polyprenyl-3-methyl-5-hydroxy-6-metoxy-1,4-benzoquinol methylase